VGVLTLPKWDNKTAFFRAPFFISPLARGLFFGRTCLICDVGGESYFSGKGTVMENTTVTRKIITIDAAKCNGCGLCVSACHEGAIGMKDGNAVLLRDDYCDGLGDCLPVCPTNAITFEEREALPYDEEAVLAHHESREIAAALSPSGIRETFRRRLPRQHGKDLRAAGR
jgi:NAD-dependent dihydropyrimidine dehydrogenase PreA subunit